MRAGVTIAIGRALEHVPIIEIFLKRDYGTLPTGKVVIDLGANVGVFTMYAAAFMPDATIYAFEPMSEFFDVLTANIARNGLSDRVKCIRSAVGGTEEGRLLFSGGGLFFPSLVGGIGASGREEEVPCTTIDRIIEVNSLEKVDMLKIDCEGAEYEILFATRRETFAKIQEIRLEYHRLQASSQSEDNLVKFLREVGYEVTHLAATASDGSNGNLWAKKA